MIGKGRGKGREMWGRREERETGGETGREGDGERGRRGDGKRNEEGRWRNVLW